MAKVALNKSELKTQNDRLKTFKKFVPSLDLKRKQIMAAINKSKRELEALHNEVRDVNRRLMDEYPMLAKSKLRMENFIEVEKVEVGTENVVGVKLPKFIGQKINVKDFGELQTPQWLDCLASDLYRACALRFRIKIAERRIELLDKALRKTTQRLNLFEKVMIPETKAIIQKIKIYLSDSERASVVQAKIAKAKTVQAAEEMS
ncbi:MAG: V-type ATP synthase subunit D [Alphaproteobacteria bacterium]